MNDSLAQYRARLGEGYSLLPLRFGRLDSDRTLLTNFCGEHLVVPTAVVRSFLTHRLSAQSEFYSALKARHFLLDSDSTVPIDLLATKYRTKQAILSRFTSLFMFVTTVRCDHECAYCQASPRGREDRTADMPAIVAERAVDFMFRSPSEALKVEFQGGESLLNFAIVRQIVDAAEQRNAVARRDLAFVITTNLSPLTDEMLTFCRDHRVCISTSLDGPRDLHNGNRPRPGHDSYQEAVNGIRRAREWLGPENVSALMTTTRASLSRGKEIIDEYVRQGLTSLFLRPLSPYGRAASPGNGYNVEEWLRFYRECLGYLIELAAGGVPIREELAAILLRKMLTPYPAAYVDLQSPAGLGIAGLVFNHDGNVYPSDEARMLAEMGDDTFCMGNLLAQSYEEIMLSDALLGPLSSTLTECVPQCSDCVFQPYCGSDPVRHYRTQRDPVGFKPASDFCRKQKGVLEHLVQLLENDSRAASVMRTWTRPQ